MTLSLQLSWLQLVFLSGAGSTSWEQPFSTDVPLVCHLWFMSQPILYLPSFIKCPLCLLTGTPTLSHVGWLPQTSETVEEEPHPVSFMSSKAVRHRGPCWVLIVIQDRTWLLGPQLKQPLYSHVNENIPWVLPSRSREGIRLSSFTSWSHDWEQSCPLATFPTVQIRDLLFNRDNLTIAASFSAHDLAAALSSLVFLSSPNCIFVAPPPSPVAAFLQTYIGGENSVDNCAADSIFWGLEIFFTKEAPLFLLKFNFMQIPKIGSGRRFLDMLSRSWPHLKGSKR